MKTMDLKQELYFEVEPNDFYTAILSKEQHEAFTGDEANISDTVNTEFSTYSNYIIGKNVLLEPGKLIIQEWRAQEENWSDYHYSTIQFKLKELDQGTHLTFIHKGIPEAYFESISAGWHTYYWEPLKHYFKGLTS